MVAERFLNGAFIRRSASMSYKEVSYKGGNCGF
jgi:hypothetical protein